jgi:hypothetical protein
MKAVTTKQIWYISGNILCVDHVGASLKCVIETKPKAVTHKTSFGEAFLLTSREISRLQQSFRNEIICETCAYEVGA